MKRTLEVFFMMMIMLPCCSKSREAEFYSDIDAALAKAGKSKKLVMIYFHTDWCSFCKKLEQETLSNDLVKRELKQFLTVKVNPEEDVRAQEAAKRYGVSGYPAIVFIDDREEKVGMINGFLSVYPFLERLHAMEAVKETETLEKQLRKGNAAAGEKLLEIYSKLENDKKLAKVIEEMDKQNILPQNKRMEYLASLGIQYLSSSQFQEASKIFQRIVGEWQRMEKNDLYYAVCFYYGYSLFLTGKEGEAKSYIEGMLKNDLGMKEKFRQEYQKLLKEMEIQTP